MKGVVGMVNPAISLSEAKEQIHVDADFTADDAYIESLIEMAHAMAEEYCGVEFCEDVPETVRHAMKLAIAHYYENRDVFDDKAYKSFRMAFQNLLYPHKSVVTMF